MGEAVLSQKNLANHNQKLSMAPITHREIVHQNQDGLKPVKKRAGASTDMVPSKMRGSKDNPLTDIRNFEQPAQFDLSPQRLQKGAPQF